MDGQECVINESGKILVGEEAIKLTCHLGLIVEEKQTDGTYNRICIGSSLPNLEICDLEYIDEDCSGVANDIIYFFNNPKNDCKSTELGVCKYSKKECIDGHMICVPPTNYGPEICDKESLDEDCDRFSER